MDKYKIYDTKTAGYSCCGTVNFNIHNPSQVPRVSAAIQDVPQCAGWWYGSAKNFTSTDYPGTLPVPGVDFYFPEDPISSDLMPLSYGPSDANIATVNNQNKLNQLFIIPINSVSGNTSTLNCTSGDLYWLRYLNPNLGQVFATTMVCSPPLDTVKTSDIYNTGNWALFRVVCDTPIGTTGCTTTGQIMGTPIAKNIGSSVLSTPGYTGGTIPIPEPTGESHVWLWILLGIVILIIIVAAIVGVIIYYKKKSKNVNMYKTNDSTDQDSDADSDSDYKMIL
jgi:hypothetical protein